MNGNMNMDMHNDTAAHGTLIGAMRESGWTMRTIASVVILTFGGLVTSPAVAAVKQEVQKIQWHKTEEGPGAKLSAHLLAIHDHLGAATRQNLKGATFSDERKQLKDDAATLADLDKQTLADFAATAKMIKDKHLPDVIQQREAAAETRYKTEMTALKQGLDAVANEQDDAKAQAKSKDVLTRLSQFQMERSQQKFDPKNLPNRSLKPDLSRKPFTTKKQFADAGFVGNPRLMVATTAPNFDYSQLPGANNPAYLAATTEVTLSPAIQAQAAALNYDPVKIYNWVRNNIQWQPTWGAVQDADLTLSAQRGNAFDISSLLIALLRASNIPARYVLGTINVPQDKFRNWAGGFQNIDAAVNYASAGGIPITSLYAGGQITTIQMQHIWVEAAIDYVPSRGAINKSADTWVPMDASYKQYQFSSGIDVVKATGIDPNALSQQFVQSGTLDSNNGSVSHLDPTIIQVAGQSGNAALQNYISQLGSNATVDDVLGGASIAPHNQRTLAASLPTNVLVVGARYGSLPAQLEQQITFSIGIDALGEPTNPMTFPWAKLNNEKVTLSFVAATPSDAQAIQALIPTDPISSISQLPLSMPAYLINVIPVLKVNDNVVLNGTPLTLGQDFEFVFTPSFVGRGSIPNTYDVIAGSYLAIAVIAGNISPQAIAANQARLQATAAILGSNDATQLATLTRDQVIGDLYEGGILGYYGQYTALSYSSGLRQGGHHYLAAGIGNYGYEPQVSYVFGIPRTIHDGFSIMNVPIINVIGYDGSDQSAKERFTLQIGMASSVLEGSVSEQIFNAQGQTGQAISAAEALTLANGLGQSLYHITQANEGQVLPNIHHNSLVMSEIQDAISAGKEVITHSDDVGVPGWTGAGYIIFDPTTGDGAYKIGGGANGTAEKVANAFSILAAGALGYVDGAIGHLADERILFSDTLLHLQFLAKLSSILGVVSLGVSVISILGNSSLNAYQKLGQVSSEFLFFGITSYVTSAVTTAAFAAGAALLWPILFAVIFAVAMAMALLIIEGTYFSDIYRRSTRRYA